MGTCVRKSVCWGRRCFAAVPIVGVVCRGTTWWRWRGGSGWRVCHVVRLCDVRCGIRCGKRCGAMQYGAAACVRCGGVHAVQVRCVSRAARCGAVCGAVRCGVVRCGAVRCGVAVRCKFGGAVRPCFFPSFVGVYTIPPCSPPILTRRLCRRRPPLGLHAPKLVC